MAQSFWSSSSASRWQFDRRSLLRSSAYDAPLAVSKSRLQEFKTFFITAIRLIGQRLRLKQRVIATAIIYFKRIYVSVGLSQYDPRIVAPTCVFIAAKCEECPANAKAVIAAAKRALRRRDADDSAMDESVSDDEYEYAVTDMLAMEYDCLQMLTFDLVVYHPYRTLSALIANMTANSSRVTQCAWAIVNDSYYTDLPLIYPPALIAVAALYTACALCSCEYRSWLTQLAVNQQTLVIMSQELLNLYSRLEQTQPPSDTTSAEAIIAVSLSSRDIVGVFQTFYHNKQSRSALKATGDQSSSPLPPTPPATLE